MRIKDLKEAQKAQLLYMVSKCLDDVNCKRFDSHVKRDITEEWRNKIIGACFVLFWTDVITDEEFYFINHNLPLWYYNDEDYQGYLNVYYFLGGEKGVYEHE